MKLLLHMCCGPCSAYPVSVLHDESINFDGYFYNPNIHPKEEFLKRMDNVAEFSRVKEISVEYDDTFMQDTWEKYSDTNDSRCRMCYSIRLDKTASFALEKGYDAFTTTLLVSPYQKHDLIKELGEEFARKYGILFYYKDFRPGFRQGQQMAKEMGLYRQKYCGCIKSLY